VRRRRAADRSGYGSRVPRRPTAPLLVVPLLALAACSFSEPDGTAAATRDRVLAEADRTVPVVVEALGGTDVVSAARWESCMGYSSWKYAGYAMVEVPQAEEAPAEGERVDHGPALTAVRAALADQGYEPVRTEDGRVSVGSEGYGLLVQPAVNPKGFDGTWKLEFRSEGCVLFDDGDNELVARDGERELDFTP
jgi:hypothetical protein